MSNLVSQNVVRASVVAGDVNTRYYRVGRGDPVLLLIDDAAVLQTLLWCFPRHLRAVAPEPCVVETCWASTVGDFNGWLCGFLDALGLHQVAVVVCPTCAAHGRAFAAAEPDRVTRLFFFPMESRDGTAAAAGAQGQRGLEASPPVTGTSSSSEAGIDRLVARIVDSLRTQEAPNS